MPYGWIYPISVPFPKRIENMKDANFKLVKVKKAKLTL
jgi:hypothetical protein